MMQQILVGAISLVVVLVLIIPISLWFAFAASILWGWFMVPIFNAPGLSMIQCWAIAITLSMFRPPIDITKTELESIGSAFAAVVLGPPLAIGLGWAIKNWWM